MTFKEWWQTQTEHRAALALAVGTSVRQLKKYAYAVSQAGPKRAIDICDAIQELTPSSLVERASLRPDLWK